MNEAKNIITQQLGNGNYISYKEVSNGFGGYHPVNLVFHNDEKQFHRQITNDIGFFVDYPGHEKGAWEEDLTMTFMPATRFVIYVSKFVDGICKFSWMVQPDGRYWEDEDGFGMTADNEVWLYALINEEGQFITPFFDKNDARYNKG